MYLYSLSNDYIGRKSRPLKINQLFSKSSKKMNLCFDGSQVPRCKQWMTNDAAMLPQRYLKLY